MKIRPVGPALIRTDRQIDGPTWRSWKATFAIYINAPKESPLDQRRVHKKTTIHRQKSHERLNGEWAKRLQFFFFFAVAWSIIW